MEKIYYTFMQILIGIIFLLTGTSCISGRNLKTFETNAIEMTGTYNLILYGARFSDDRETIAILDKAGDKYEFVIFAPEFDYKIKQEVNAKEAIAEAEKFVRFHRSFHQSRLSKIIDHEGNTIGYEMRPLYLFMELRYSDVLDVNYILDGNKVIVKIKLVPEVERKLYGDDFPFEIRMR